MSSPFVGEIRMFAGTFAPAGWALCNGALVAIAENEALFALIGTTYGGDGQTNFALPNLQSRIPVHVGTGFQLGQNGGAESITLTTAQIPAHNHNPLFTTSGSSVLPTASTILASATSQQPFLNIYTTDTSALTPFAPQTGVNTGGNQPHDNMVPFLVVNFIISLFGIFPSQS